jgi:hypothetical protein
MLLSAGHQASLLNPERETVIELQTRPAGRLT